MSSASISHPHSVKEINVPTPWGQLATKCWNFPSDDIRDLKSATTPPVVCLHGWQDNAGTWDKLIPLLDRDIPFICLDFCGHGKSSPRPVGSSNDFPLHVWDVKRVLDFLGLDSGVNLMGHSMGGAVSVCFAATFPDMMNKCLTFDAPAPFPRNAAHTPEQLASAITKNLDFEKSQRSAPQYTYEVALQRFLKGRSVEMEEESARTLLQRGLKQVDVNEDGEALFEFARDVKVTFPSFLPFDVDQVTAMVKHVSCHLRLFLFKDNYWARVEAGGEDWHERQVQMRNVAFGIFEKNCRSFQATEVEGRHHGHLDHPEVVAAEVNAFLKKGDSKL